jgi:hypothetical protein
MRLIRRRHITRNDTAMPPNLLLLHLRVLFGSTRGNGFFVAEHEQRRVAVEEAVDVFEAAAGGFGVQEVDWRREVLVWVFGSERWVELPIGIKEKLKTTQMM